jgi:transcriptional regulator with XRE-family HTH domain
VARGTPQRMQREARPGAAFPAEHVARNVRAYRGLRGMLQEDLARLMSELGLGWTASIVGFVERGQRSVTVDELAALTWCFGLPVGLLLDPTGPDGRNDVAMDMGGVDHPSIHLDPVLGRRWARGEIEVSYGGGQTFDVRSVGAEAPSRIPSSPEPEIDTLTEGRRIAERARATAKKPTQKGRPRRKT